MEEEQALRRAVAVQMAEGRRTLDSEASEYQGPGKNTRDEIRMNIR